MIKDKNINLSPLSQQEIRDLELRLKIKLPIQYKDFLLSMGRGAGKFMQGSSVFYDDIFSLNEWGKELIEENGFKELPEDAFVFWMHQGYQLAFFRLSEGEDPPIYYYSETIDQDDYIKKEDSLSAFLQNQMIMSGIMNA